jgi:hypothetical protein
MQKMNEKVKVVQKNLRITQSRQKNNANNRTKEIEILDGRFGILKIESVTPSSKSKPKKAGISPCPQDRGSL